MQDTVFTPPEINGLRVEDSYFGKKITDPYRNLEDLKDSSIVNWYKKQTNYANTLLDSIKGRDTLIEQLYEINNRKSFFLKRQFITENDTRFYLKKLAGKSYKLYYKKATDSLETLLFDPKTYKEETENKYYINYIKPSWDEKYIVASLTYSGKEHSELVIIDVAKQKQLPQTITNAWPSSFLGVNWLPDNSGFTYLHFPETTPDHPDFKKNSQSVLYTLGQDPKQLNYIFGNKTHPQLNINAKEKPTTKIKYANDKYIVGYISGVDNYWSAYYAKIEYIKAGLLNWKPLFKSEDKVKTSRGIFKGDDYIYMTNKNAENFKLASVNTNALNFDDPTVLFEEKEDEVIKSFRVTKDAIYVVTSKYGIEAQLYKIDGNETQKLELPKKAGRIDLAAKSVNYDDMWITISGWISDDERYVYDVETNTFEEANFTDDSVFPEFENMVMEEVLVPSHDGIQVPLSIIYNKNIKKDSDNPTFFFGYGAYGDNISPVFSPIFLNFVREGGVLCYPHVRGGGEKGDAWHQGGFKTTKPNTWKDLIACTEYMIDQKYTSKNKTAIYGGSAGGIMVGRAMTERPDLFAAVITNSGALNVARMESEKAIGGSNYKEFGTIKDSTECMALLEMDAYLHIKDSVDYPATYLTVGMNDPRVVPWESGKFAARMQQANALKKPILLHADFDTGHSGGSGMKFYREWANVFSFVFWQTGHPNYQLKE